MEIRVLQREDAVSFQSLRLDALRECPTEFSSSYEEECDYPLSHVAERLAPGPHGAIFGAFEGGRLVGTVGLYRERERKLAHKGVIWGVYVAPTFRRHGVGRALLEFALAHAASMPGIRQVLLSANTANPASTSLYKSVGFEPFGVERGFMIVDGVPQDEIHMSLHISNPSQSV
jgi:RimJ/RimL family protein N-acetyltransferase